MNTIVAKFVDAELTNVSLSVYIENLVLEYNDVDVPVTEPLSNSQVVPCTDTILQQTPLDTGMFT